MDTNFAVFRYFDCQLPYGGNAFRRYAWQNNILICLGGADPNNDTLAILKKLKAQDIQDRIIAILGAAYLHRNELEKYIALHLPNTELRSNLRAKEMVAVMRECPVAILPPSTIVYEYLHVGGTA